MEPKGTLLVSSRFKSDKPGWSDAAGKFCTIMDEAVDCSSFLVMLEKSSFGTQLVDVPRKFAMILIPFVKDNDGLLIPTDMDMVAKAIFRGKMMLDGVDRKKPMEQLEWIYKNYPQYWERERKGEFYPNGILAIRAEMEALLIKHKDKFAK